MRARALLAGATAAAAVSLSPVAWPAASGSYYELEPAGSTLTFIATQQGATFESGFESFSASVRFDPASPGTGTITARVDLSSVDTGNPERDEILKGADWFGTGRWPEAVFTSERIDRSGDAFVARGVLLLRGVHAPVTLRFTWLPVTGVRPARLQGTADLRRLDFGIGAGEWRDTTYVGNNVSVRVDVLLKPPKAGSSP